MAYWRQMLIKVKEHMYDRNPEAFYYLSTENARQMKTVYSRFNNIHDMIDYLEYRADLEDEGYNSSGAVLTSLGGEL